MYIDLQKQMVLIKGIDKTAEIREVDDVTLNGKRMVTYKSGKSYPFDENSVVVLNNPEKIDLNGNVAYKRDIPIYEPQAILDFGKYIRIIKSNGYADTIIKSDFSVIANGMRNEKIGNILSYLKNISQYMADKPEDEIYLKKELEQIKFIHPESVLNLYLNQQEFERTTTSDNKIIFPFRFNLSQRKALENALSSQISVIEGPPGTGKTQTILNIIANLVAVYGKTVAVVSNNNEAVKNVLEKMEKKGYDFLLALLGRTSNQEKFFENMPMCQVKGWDCQESTQELMQQVEDLNKRINRLLKLDRECMCLRQEVRAWSLEQKHFHEYYDRQEIDAIANLPLFQEKPERILSFLAEFTVVDDKSGLGKLIWRLKLLFKYRIFNYAKLSENEKEIVLVLQKAFYSKRIESLKEEIERKEVELKSASFDELREEHQIISERLFRKCIYESHNGLNEPDFSKKSYKAKYGEFIKRYPIILSTTYALRHSIPDNYLLDYVIIDEASQVDLITATLVFSCCRNVIIVGDEKQLSQIVDTKIKGKLEHKIENPAFDYFEKSILTSVNELYGEKIPRTILREHYRCHPQIIEFCNQKYYKGKLIAYTNMELSDKPLIIYKTAKGNHMRRVTKGKEGGTYNQREIDVIEQEVLSEMRRLGKTDNIGVVTPYRKQANKISECLSEDIESDTVHKYQGKERDVMIMSTVLDTSGLGRSSIRFVDNAQMINVAVSRAIKQFVLVTDYELFFKYGNEIRDLIRYMQYNTLDKAIVESNIVSVFDLLYREYSPKLNAIKRKMRKNMRYASEEVLRVLLQTILSEPQYASYDYAQGVLLCNLINDTEKLSEEELSFINHRASVDFVVYYKQDKSCKLIIEVDGFAFHENNPEQLKRDALKDAILSKYELNFLRLATNGSGEKEKIRNALTEE